MNHDYAKQGVLNENHQGSAAFTRERLRRRAIIPPQNPVPSAGMPAGSDALAGIEPCLTGPSPGEPMSGPPPSS